MESETVVRVKNVSKAFRIWDTKRGKLSSLIYDKVGTLFGAKEGSRFHALKGVSFELKKGDCMGVVGRNGSGKSTLLQIISGVLPASEGSVEVNGMLAAQLELEAAFPTSLTGIENIYLQGSVYGFTKREMKELVPRIIKFSELNEFLDQPLDTYSSGMRMRLAFSIQTVIEPDILIVDEALGVGDEGFQRKCFAVLEKLRERGTTLMFVTHSSSLITALCNRAILLDSGQLVYEGDPNTVVTIYNKLTYADDVEARNLKEKIISDPLCVDIEGAGLSEESAKNGPTHYYDPNLKSKSSVALGIGKCRISDPRLSDGKGKGVNYIVSGERYSFKYLVDFTESLRNIVCSMTIKTTSGFVIASGKSHNEPEFCRDGVASGERWSLEFQFLCKLLPGFYFIEAGVRGTVGDDHPILHAINDWVLIRVLDDKRIMHRGVVNLFEEVNCEKVVSV